MKLPEIPQAWKDEIAANPKSAFAQRAMAVQRTINFENKEEIRLDKTSKIGNRMLMKFASRVSALPCSECKRSIGYLNRRTADQVESDRDSIVQEIFNNSQNAGAAWWAKASMALDKIVTGGETMKTIIGLWLNEAIKEEREESAKGV